jgi:hypothetical protein
MKKYIYLLLGLCLITSCDKRIKQCKDATGKFFTAVMEKDEDAMLDVYPLAHNMHYFPHSDSYKINSVSKTSDTLYQVSLTNTYSKGESTVNKDVFLYMKPEDETSMTIVDSKGLYPKDRVKLHKYALRHDLIPKGCETDQQLGAVDDSIRNKLVSTIIRMQAWPYDYFEISHINWRYLLDSATGSFLITNKSSYTLDSPKYKLTYYNNRDEIVAADDGHITYSKFKPGDMVKVDIFTQHVGRATFLRVQIDLDLEETLENILDNN